MVGREGILRGEIGDTTTVKGLPLISVLLRVTRTE